MHIYISNQRESVDASLVRKDHAVQTLIGQFLKLQPSQVAVIGHRESDIPMLRIPGLGLTAVVYNADENVKGAIKTLPHAYISNSFGLDGFFDVYHQSRGHGIKHLITVRDGVLYRDETFVKAQEFSQRMADSSLGLTIITATHPQKNKLFATAYNLVGLSHRQPHLLYVENGALHYDLAANTLATSATPEDVQKLREFKHAALESIVRSNTLGRDYQVGLAIEPEKLEDACPLKVCYVPHKHTMLTIQIPESSHRHANFQYSAAAASLRQELVRQLTAVGTALGHTVEKI